MELEGLEDKRLGYGGGGKGKVSKFGVVKLRLIGIVIPSEQLDEKG